MSTLISFWDASTSEVNNLESPDSPEEQVNNLESPDSPEEQVNNLESPDSPEEQVNNLESPDSPEEPQEIIETELVQSENLPASDPPLRCSMRFIHAPFKLDL